MNKKDLIANVADRMNAPKTTTAQYVDSVFEVIEQTLKAGERVQIVGFGSFEVKDTPERDGVNPRNPQQTIRIPAGKRVKFSAGKGLKDAIKNI
ncbi:HU family DNA-binding protein [Peptoniphilus sp. MSJ-1]|uniref:HU family DNA-binding protein n=1 Tax=Peptoniphilus ovalis TaxID=2841503 RepID=A0ABS6FHH5_9FIRM|nr:HU family DNA-binding protein [Peptoniphilus ovalis]MBU5669621.1 HU family DNA-binding protein [Peptoniphilus ovalis]